jgi:hypothetical protein
MKSSNEVQQYFTQVNIFWVNDETGTIFLAEQETLIYPPQK